jgi:hypothetical protein
MSNFIPVLNPIEKFEAHVHSDDRMCFSFPERRNGSWSKQQLLKIDGHCYAAAYYNYTWSWYIFDVESGAEAFDHVSPKIFERHFAHRKIADLKEAAPGEC